MKENKFDFSVFMAVIMLIVLIGGLLVGTVFGIVNNKQVAYADTAFNENLLAHTDYSGFDFVNTTSGQVNGFPYPENSFYLGGPVGSLVGTNDGITFNASTGFMGGTFAFLYNFVNGSTYTFSMNVLNFNDNGSSLQFYATSSIGNHYTPNSSNLTVGVFSYTFVANYDDLSKIQCLFHTSQVLKFDKVKLELGDTFTGWSDPYQDGYDAGYQNGYNAGFDAGLNSFAGRTNYQFIGNLGRVNDSALQDNPLLDLDFVFQNQHYTLLNSQNTPVQYEDGSTYSFYHPDGQWSIDYLPGVKVVSNLLYGNILITCPYWIGGSMFWQIAFEDTITGAVVYTDYRDTLHYKFVPSYTFQTNSQATTSGSPALDSWNFFDIEYFFQNPQNIYFIPSRVNHLWDLSTGDIVKYPDNEFFNIYSTQSQTALSSFDDGYQKGVEAGREGAVSENAQAVSNARAAGYEEGRRDALVDSNDYSFMGLLGAVFDAPIKSFQGLLNFDVLGVNMQSFVLALLSLSVIIIIIKIALGGK